MRLKDRVAVVTGSAQGMGYAILRSLAREGAKVVVCDISKKGVERAVVKLKGQFEQVLGEVVDVTNKAQVLRAVRSVPLIYLWR